MHLSNDGLQFIAQCEGKHEAIGDGRYRAYQCVVGHRGGKPVYDGKWTIYTGLTEGTYEGMIVTEAEGEAMFRRELNRFETAVNKLVKVPLTQTAYDSLVSFAYNCGEGALSRSTLLRKLNKGDYEGAAREFHKWVNSNGVKRVPGLVKRRAMEAEMFLRPDKAASVPSMPQEIEEPKPVKDAVRSSRTVFGVLTALGASLVGWMQDTVAQMELLAPVKQIGSGLGLKGATILFAITVAGLALALFARLDDAKQGKVIK